MLELSGHAESRIAQRNLSKTDVEFVVCHGRREHRAGAIFCQLTRRDLTDKLARSKRYARLVGTTVVLCRCCEAVVTAYRNDRAFKKDRCKAKYDNRTSARHTCAYCGSNTDDIL